MKRLRYILRSRYLFKILVIVSLLYGILFTTYYPFKSKYTINNTSFTGVVTKIQIKENKLILEIKAKEKLIINYKYQDEIFNNLSYGDKVLVKGKLTTPTSSTIPNIFNYKKYLYNKKIYFVVEASSITKLQNNSNYLYTIKTMIYERANKLKSSNYLKTFLLSDTSSLSKEVKESYRNIGVAHLFSVSGMHISIFTGIIYFYLDRITYKKKIKYIIIDLFLLFYFLLLKSTSLFRSTIMYILFSINDILKLKIKKLDIMLLTLALAVIINPFIIYDIGFIYSYLISFFLVISSSKIKSKKKPLKILYPTLISFLVSTPITIYTNYQINLISIFANIILVPLVSTIIFPLTIITFIFPMFDDILSLLTYLFEVISIFLNKVEFTKIILSKPSIILLIIYYIVIIIILHKPKLCYLFIILLSIHKSLPYFDSNLKVVMLDVGEGDSLFIKLPYNKGNILIDTGGESSSYSKIKEEIIPYFKSFGISKLNYLILSHGDSDHIGGASSLISNFKVKNVIFNIGEYNNLELELINILEEKNIKYYKNVEKLNINKYKLYFLNTREYNNENDNSNVIFFQYNKIKMLFMGDAGKEKELDILEKYNINNIDILKVGHHGSSTSSSRNFIDTINPSNCLISVGKNNIYGHPNKNVLDILSNCSTYRTDIKGSIEIKLSKNKYKIKTYSS